MSVLYTSNTNPPAMLAPPRQPARLLAIFLACSALAVSAADELGQARSLVLAEARLERFAFAGGEGDLVREGVEWHAGRILWLASRERGWAVGARAGGLLPEGRLNADDAELAALMAPVLAAAYALPGQRFHRSPRVASVLRGMADAIGASPLPASVSGDPVWAERGKALALAAIRSALAETGEARSLARIASALRARSETAPACAVGLAWRARTLFALACLEGDPQAAAEAAKDMRQAVLLAAGEERAFDPARSALLVADALALAEWAQGTGFALDHAVLDWVADQAKEVARWGWLGDRFDPVLVPGTDAADRAAWAFLEAAFRSWAIGGGPSGYDTLREWTRRDGPIPSPAAVHALALWPDRPEEVAPDLQDDWFQSPGDTFVVRDGRDGRWSFRGMARRGGVWAPDGAEGWFNPYSCQRAEGVRVASEAGFRTGGLRGSSFGFGGAVGEARLVFTTPLAEHGLGQMAALRLESGGAWLKVRRAWAAFPQGLAFAVAGLEGRSAQTRALPWACVSGRDRNSWLEVRLAERQGFDVVRLFFAPAGGSWRGVPRRVRVMVSDDRTNWSVVATEAVRFDVQEPPPAVWPVSVPFDRVEGRFVRVLFPEGGTGGVVRVLEAEVRRTVRDASGGVAGESDDLALASLGATAAAESSASADHAAHLAINGVREMLPAPLGEMALGLFVAPAGGEVALGLGEERERFALPPGVRRKRVEGVYWAHDGAAGFAFSRPVDLVFERIGSQWVGGEVVLDGGGLGVFVFSGGGPDEAERFAGGGVVWHALAPDAVHVELKGEGLGFVAAFDAFRREAAEAEEPCCLLYRRREGALDVYADWQRRSRVGLAAPGVRRATLNGVEVPVADGDWLVLPLGAEGR